MGFDSFGLNAENAAIRDNAHPATFTYENIAVSTESCKKFGVSFDWTRTFNTSDPEYYRWTQWLFLKFRERGLAYRKNSPVNWCPFDQTVLANEQVIDGRCERCGNEVTKRELTQWYFKITDYAQELLDDLDDLAPTWPERVINAQRNWIGRSEGAHVTFPGRGARRADRGLHHAARHAVRRDVHGGGGRRGAGRRAGHRRAATGVRRVPGGGAQGQRHRAAVHRPPEDRRVPGRPRDQPGERRRRSRSTPPTTCWPTTAPARSWRCRPRTSATGTSRRPSTCRSSAPSSPPRAGRARPSPATGPAVNSHNDSVYLDGMGVDEAKRAIIDWLEAQGVGQGAVNFRLRDWLLSRQRYWGAPIPIIHCPTRRRGAGPRGPAARRAARAARRRPDPEGRLAAGRGDRLGQRHLPDLRRTGHARQRHDGHLRGLVVVLPALLLAARRHPGLRPRAGQPVGSVRHLHRRRRARRAAPAVRAVLHHGAARHGAAGVRRAVLRPAEPGHRHQRGRQDVEVQGQRRQIGGATIGVRRGRGAADPGLRGPSRGRHRLGRHVAERLGAVPAACLAAERRRDVRARRRSVDDGDVALRKVTHRTRARGRAAGREPPLQRDGGARPWSW